MRGAVLAALSQCINLGPLTNNSANLPGKMCFIEGEVERATEKYLFSCVFLRLPDPFPPDLLLSTMALAVSEGRSEPEYGCGIR